MANLVMVEFIDDEEETRLQVGPYVNVEIQGPNLVAWEEGKISGEALACLDDIGCWLRNCAIYDRVKIFTVS